MCVQLWISHRFRVLSGIFSEMKSTNSSIYFYFLKSFLVLSSVLWILYRIVKRSARIPSRALAPPICHALRRRGRTWWHKHWFCNHMCCSKPRWAHFHRLQFIYVDSTITNSLLLLGVPCDITKAYYDLGSVPEGTTYWFQPFRFVCGVNNLLWWDIRNNLFSFSP
jgi:hypothetical protein